MTPATPRNEYTASAPVLYMALELSNQSWRPALSDGARRRQVSVPAANLSKLAEAVAKAKQRFERRGRNYAARPVAIEKHAHRNLHCGKAEQIRRNLISTVAVGRPQSSADATLTTGPLLQNYSSFTPAS